ncbi:MAG: hypothetical protein ACHQ3O_11575 [Candidatus Limnocylindria bacterium]
MQNTVPEAGGRVVSSAAADAALDGVVERLEDAQAPGFACAREGAGFRLEIWGCFPPDWCGNLSLQCYAARLSILSGEARRVRAAHWAGRFLLASAGGPFAPSLDFLQMVRRRPQALLPPSDLAIDALRIERAAQGAGAEIRLAAPDRLGFLAFVLDRFAFCGLYPHRLVLRTSPENKIDDWFQVFGVGGTPPSEHALATLSNLLAPALARSSRPPGASDPKAAAR